MAKKLVWVVPLCFMGVLFYWPVSQVLILGIGNFKLDAAALSAIWFTLWQAAVSTLLAVALSLPVAHLLYRRSFAGQNLLRAFFTVPFVLPVIVVAIGFASIRRLFDGVGSIPWIVAAHVFFNIAIAVRTIGSAWAGMDDEPLEAARLDGAGRLRIFWSVQLAALRSAISASAALIFLYCLASFSTVLILGGGSVHSIETEIFFSTEQYLDLGRSGALALVQLLIGLSVFGVSVRLGSTQVKFAGQAAARMPRVGWRDWFGVVVTTLGFLGLAAPMVSVFIQSLSNSGITNYLNLGGKGARSVLNVSLLVAAENSLRNLAITLLIAVGLGCFVARLLWRRGNIWLELVFLVPLSVSSVVLGLGYLLGFATPGFSLRDSWLVVPIAQSMVLLPLVIRVVRSALQATESEITEAAELDGANAWKSWWGIEVPLIRQSLATAIVFVTVGAIGEFGAASLLVFGDQETLPTVLYRLMARPGTENFGMAMAASSLLILATFAAVLVAGFTRENEPRLRQRQIWRA